MTQKIACWWSYWKSSTSQSLPSTTQMTKWLILPYSIVLQVKGNLHIQSPALVALATKFIRFLLPKALRPCPYCRVQRCIIFHQFHTIRIIILKFFIWNGRNQIVDHVKHRARTVDWRTMAPKVLTLKAFARRKKVKGNINSAIFVPDSKSV